MKITTYENLIKGKELAFEICSTRAEVARKNGDTGEARKFEQEASEHYQELFRLREAALIHGEEIAVV